MAMLKDKYAAMNDGTLLDRINAGDGAARDYLIGRYKNMVKIKTRQYFIVGADREDLVQEGMIGLYKAIRDYDDAKNVSFYTFAELCVTRQMITAIKAATRQKHTPLNHYVSLNAPVFDDDSDTYLDMLSESRVTSPEETLIGREDKLYIERRIEEALSVFECRVLSLYLQGKSYAEIAKFLSKDEKSVDNAIQRVRRKVDKIIRRKRLDAWTG
ncbi:MAG: RNA polymerase sporulation sigma factor SigH [Clostridiales bacterium]|jgi:RNA polymerase sporulation-specific sigma factor|nr:RNA polymerase sporulation sigma factor SigH [Clostridiales bacterium]